MKISHFTRVWHMTKDNEAYYGYVQSMYICFTDTSENKMDMGTNIPLLQWDGFNETSSIYEEYSITDQLEMEMG